MRFICINAVCAGYMHYLLRVLPLLFCYITIIMFLYFWNFLQSREGPSVLQRESAISSNHSNDIFIFSAIVAGCLLLGPCTYFQLILFHSVRRALTGRCVRWCTFFSLSILLPMHRKSKIVEEWILRLVRVSKNNDVCGGLLSPLSHNMK